jgi:hypothetical protein
MKTQKLFRIIVVLCASLAAPGAFAQGTAFTYQGLLTSNGVPVNATYDLEFSLYNAGTGPSQVGSTVTYSSLPITNGVFTVLLDFGGVFNGTSYWLQISNRPTGGGAYTALTPRQQLTPTPYAVTSENVDGLVSASQLTGSLPAGLLSGTYGNPIILNNLGNSFGGTFSGIFSGDGSGLTGLNASQLATGTVPDARLSANVALLNANQTFSGANIFTGSKLVVSNASGIDASSFTGLSLQYDGPSGEAAFMASFTNNISGFSGESFFQFYTKNYSQPIARQMIINQDGVVGIDQSGYNAGFLNNGDTNGAGLTFGPGSGEGIASQRTAGVDQYSLDFYTSFLDRMIIMNNGFVGINTTNPTAQLQVVSTNANTTTPGVRSASGGASANELTGYGFYSAAGEFIGANGVVGVGTTNFVSSDGVVGIAKGLGRAVYGYYADTAGGTGYGVYGYSSSTNGTGVYAQGANSSSAALTIGNGGIRVAGAGIGASTAAFIQLTAAANIGGDSSYINNPLCNGDPNALLFVTHNYNPPNGKTDTFFNKAFGVWYTGSEWAIYTEDQSAMPTNIAFNVLIIKH